MTLQEYVDLAKFIAKRCRLFSRCFPDQGGDTGRFNLGSRCKNNAGCIGIDLFPFRGWRESPKRLCSNRLNKTKGKDGEQEPGIHKRKIGKYANDQICRQADE